MSVPVFTEPALFEILDPSHHDVVMKWLDRGDGVAVYENSDLDSSRLGHRQFVSYGSQVALIETAEPPTRLPDIGSQVNWAYTLIGTCKR